MTTKKAIRWLCAALLAAAFLTGCPMPLDTDLLQKIKDMAESAAALAAVPDVDGPTSTSDTTPTWTWTIPSGAVGFRYQLDGEAEGSWTVVGGGVSSYTPAGALALGAHTLYVQAGNVDGKWSASGSHELTIVIGVPGNVDASDGTSTSQVSLSWDSVEGASSYYIFRNTTNTPPAGELTTTTGVSYNDTSATPGQLYYYWVRSYGSMGLGAYSSSASGYRKLGSTTISNTSNGSSTDYIEITFGSVTGATSYQLYRSTDTTAPIDATTPTLIGIVSGPYQDTTASPGVYYYYWVRAAASSSSSTGAWSTISDSGYRKLSAPVLSYSYYDDGWVNLDWPDVVGATSYDIERRNWPSGSFSQIENVDAGQTSYEDYPGTFAWFEYRVDAKSPVGASEWSNVVLVYTNIGG